MILLRNGGLVFPGSSSVQFLVACSLSLRIFDQIWDPGIQSPHVPFRL